MPISPTRILKRSSTGMYEDFVGREYDFTHEELGIEADVHGPTLLG
jgi:hypothetical protein